MVQVQDQLQSLLAQPHANTRLLQIEQRTVQGWTSIPAPLAESECPQLENEGNVDTPEGAVKRSKQRGNNSPAFRHESQELVSGAEQQLNQLATTTLKLRNEAVDNQHVVGQRPYNDRPELQEYRSRISRLVELPLTPLPTGERALPDSETAEVRPRKPSPIAIQDDSYGFTNIAEEIEALAVCVEAASEFSQDFLESIYDQYLHTPCSSAPDYHFELSSNFFPEQYVSHEPFHKRITVLSMVELGSRGEQRLDKYCLLFAETPRRWRRVTVTAASLVRSEEAVRSTVSTTLLFAELQCKILPGVVQPLLEKLLPSIDFADTVTKVSISLKMQGPGPVGFDLSRISVGEDFEEAEACESSEYLHDIDNMGCPQFLESEIVVYQRMSASTYLVLAESQLCIEWKARFGESGTLESHPFKTWINNLKILRHIEGCEGVAKFVGVVVDDGRRHIKSYLQEYVGPSIKSIFEKSQANDAMISWRIRETWAKQIIQAVAEVHRRGIIIQRLHLRSIGIDDQKKAVLTDLILGSWKDHQGLVPPEFRRSVTLGPMLPDHKGTFRTDIYQLGLLLYLMAEHCPTPLGIYCKKAGCKSIPWYRCTAEHSNPITLPRCGPDVPSYFNDIISACRCADPQERFSAASLLQLFPPSSPSEPESDEDDSWLGNLSPVDPVQCFIHCDGCGDLTTDHHYHCNVCDSGELDFCVWCFLGGISCWDETHTLVRRVLKNGMIINDTGST